MVEEVGGICYHHFHRNLTWVGKCPVGSGRLYVGTKAAKQTVSHGKKTAFADVISGARVCSIPPIQWNEEFLEEVRKAALLDEQYQSGLQSLSADPGSSDYIQPSEYLTLENNILHYMARLYIPRQLVPSILQSEHDSQIAGHFGMDKTTELIWWNVWWPSMIKEIEEYVKSCPDCQKNKAKCHKQYGLLSPLELPYAPWQSIAMDFITNLLLSNGCTELWVVINRFTKMPHFIPLKENTKTAADLARRFAKEIW